MALLMFEWSTPFMNAYFMFDQIETLAKTTSETFKKRKFISSVIFALFFFVVRILWGHYHYYLFITYCISVWGEVYAVVNVSLLFLILVAFLLNGTWMIQIIKAGLAPLLSKDKELKKEE